MNPLRRDLEEVAWPCCGVFACALLHPEKHTFWTVFAVARQVLGKAKSWRGRMHWPMLKKLFKHFGISHTELEGFDGYSFGRAVRELRPEETYLVEVTMHYLVLQAGYLYDQANPTGRHATTSPRWNQRVKRVWKIL